MMKYTTVHLYCFSDGKPPHTCHTRHWTGDVSGPAAGRAPDITASCSPQCSWVRSVGQDTGAPAPAQASQPLWACVAKRFRVQAVESWATHPANLSDMILDFVSLKWMIIEATAEGWDDGWEDLRIMSDITNVSQVLILILQSTVYVSYWSFFAF